MPDDDGGFLSRRLRWDDEAGLPENRSDIGRFPVAPVADRRSFERRDLDRIDAVALDRRRQLWRDTAIILSGLVAALLVANFMFGQVTGFAGASPSPFGTGLTAGPSASPREAAGSTPEPVLDPGAGLDATPVPVIRLPPTGTAPPRTPRPTRTPKPTQRPPTPAPTVAPTPEPTPEVTPEITPPPPTEPPPTEPPLDTPAPGP
jgi:hypothetical protein